MSQKLTPIHTIRQHHLKHQNPVVFEDEYLLIYAKILNEEPFEFLIYPKFWKDVDPVCYKGTILPIDELGEPIFLTFDQVNSFVDGLVKLMMKGAKKRYDSLSKFEKNAIYGVKPE